MLLFLKKVAQKTARRKNFGPLRYETYQNCYTCPAINNKLLKKKRDFGQRNFARFLHCAAFPKFFKARYRVFFNFIIMKEHNKKSCKLIGCEFCEQNIPFELPEAVLEACQQGSLVIFAGAGISTEGKKVFPCTLYDEIRAELDIREDISFPLLMTKFVQKTKDKRLLLQKIKQRIDYAKSFPELYRQITRFHQELSTIHQVKEIITTNWDDFFEVECAALPLVTD